MFIGIIALIICAKWPSPSESLVVKTAKFTQFIYYQNELKKQAEKLQNNGVSPTLVTVCIDSFGSLAYGIAFDPTGEIMLPVKNRSRSWLLSAEQTELSIEGMEAKHIVGNYYSWLHP